MAPTRVRCVVVDFDGTFTDIETEARPFEPAFIDSVSDLLGRDVSTEWSVARRLIEESPEKFGWVYDGKIVAPATADPYLVCTATVQAVLDRAGILKSPAHRTEITQALYGLAYTKTQTAFKHDARKVLASLLEGGVPTFVVTNSKTDAVARKLDGLALPHSERLGTRGEAKKFWVVAPEPSDARFDALPETLSVASLPRAIYVRRGKYYEALRRIWQESETTPESTLVVGDIFELDLALPAALGAKVVLVERPNTLAYERAATLAAGGHIVRELSEVLPLLD